jgi:hypothetical protein
MQRGFVDRPQSLRRIFPLHRRIFSAPTIGFHLFQIVGFPQNSVNASSLNFAEVYRGLI